MKQWFATNWVSIFALLFSGFAALYSVCNETKNSVSRDKVKIELALAKLDSLNKEQKELWAQSIKESAYKEDFYLTQLEVQSGLVILYVSVLFGFFGIIGYAVFYKEMNDIRKDYDDLKNELSLHLISLNKKVEEYDKKVTELEPRIRAGVAHSLALNANVQMKFENYIAAFLLTADAINQYVKSRIPENADYNVSINKNISNNINKLLKCLEMMRDDEENYQNTLNVLKSTRVKEAQSILEEIHSKVSGTDLSTMIQVSYMLQRMIEVAENEE